MVNQLLLGAGGRGPPLPIPSEGARCSEMMSPTRSEMMPPTIPG